MGLEMNMHPRFGSGDAILASRNGINRLAASSGFFVFLVVVNFGEFGIDDVFFFFALGCTAGGAAARLLVGGLFVHRFAELHRSLLQRIGFGRDRFRIGALQGFLEIGHGVFDGAAFGLADLGAVFGQRLLGHMDKRLGVVLRLDLGFALLVFLGVSFGILDHLLDVALGEAAGGLDADLLLLARAFVLGRHVDDAIGVDVEGDLDLRHAARRRRNADKIELAEHLVVGRHLALTLEH